MVILATHIMPVVLSQAEPFDVVDAIQNQAPPHP